MKVALRCEEMRLWFGEKEQRAHTLTQHTSVRTIKLRSTKQQIERELYNANSIWGNFLKINMKYGEFVCCKLLAIEPTPRLGQLAKRITSNAAHWRHVRQRRQSGAADFNLLLAFYFVHFKNCFMCLDMVLLLESIAFAVGHRTFASASFRFASINIHYEQIHLYNVANISVQFLSYIVFMDAEAIRRVAKTQHIHMPNCRMQWHTASPTPGHNEEKWKRNAEEDANRIKIAVSFDIPIHIWTPFA